MKHYGNSKAYNAKRLFSALVAGVACLVVLHIATSPANDAAAMLEQGYVLWLMPLVFAPVQYFLILKACNGESSSGKLFPRTTYVSCFLILCIAPLIASSVAAHLWLSSVDIPTQNLTSSDIQALQNLQVERSAFPFGVRFSWQRDRVRVVYRRGESREQVVRAKLRELSLPE
jgi:hypothetical protein